MSNDTTERGGAGNESGNAAELTDEQIESLAQVICRTGDEPEQKSEALLVLMHEIAEADRDRTRAR